MGALAQLVSRFLPGRRAAEKSSESYTERVQRLIASLNQSATEAESVAREMSELLQARAATLADAEQQLEQLEQKEKKLTERLSNLEEVRPEAVRAFEAMMDRRITISERSSLKYFVWGVTATVFVGVATFLATPLM